MVKEYFNAASVMAGATKKDFLIRGIITIILGCLLLTQPLNIMRFLCTAVGILFLLGGAWTFLTLAMTQKERRLFWAIYGFSQLIFGFVLIVHFAFAQKVLAYLIAIWFFAGGFMSLWDTARKNAPFAEKAIPLVSALVTIFIGFLFFSWPLMGLSGMFWLTGLILIVQGIMLLCFASILSRFETLSKKISQDGK